MTQDTFISHLIELRTRLVRMVAVVLDRRSAAEELGVGPTDHITLTPLEGVGVTSPVALRPTR